MNKDEASKPFLLLREAVEKIAEDLGLTLESWGVVFNPDPALTNAQAVFNIKPEAVMSPAEKEQYDIDKQFEDMAEGERQEDLYAKRMDEGRRRVQELLGEMDV